MNQKTINPENFNKINSYKAMKDQSNRIPQEYFFEGSEKLLEIWFNGDQNKCDLRDIPRNSIVAILDKVNCKIISQLSNDSMDSYVLSESSLFMSRQRIVLKTCGTTFLLNALKPILDCAKMIGFEDYQIFYSRRRFEFPACQPLVHQDFNNEIDHFDSMINVKGNAYTFGRLNDEYWNFYVTEKPLMPERSDQTFEMIMMDLDVDKMRHFYRVNSIDGADATKKSGIDKLFPKAAIDDFLFEPCGYSMNGLIEDDKYLTIHITPENGFSYVSFETNYPVKDYAELIQKLLEMFGPEKFLLSLISEESSTLSDSHNKLIKSLNRQSGYLRKDLQRCFVCDLELTFAYVVRKHG